MVGKLIVFILYLIECQCRPSNTTTTPITTTTTAKATTTITAKTNPPISTTAKSTSTNTTTARTTTAKTTTPISNTAKTTSANTTTTKTTTPISTTTSTTTDTPTTTTYPTPPNVQPFITTPTTTSTTSTYRPPYYANDNMGVSDKKKILNLTSDLIVESKLALRQVISIAYDQSSFDGYHYGVLYGKIREEYRSMMEIYKTALNRLPGFNYSLVIPPSSRVVRPIQYIHYMHSANKLERDIEQMVQLMLWINTGAVTLRPQRYLPGPAIPPLRTRMEVAKKNQERAVKTKLRAAENRVKSRIREAHLMRRLGLPANTSTTKKRFVNRWPVEETWMLNDYETT